MNNETIMGFGKEFVEKTIQDLDKNELKYFEQIVAQKDGKALRNFLFYKATYQYKDVLNKLKASA